MTEAEIRFLAIQLATQLPSKPRDARRVIGVLRDLVDNWLFNEAEPQPALSSDGSNLKILMGRPEASPR